MKRITIMLLLVAMLTGGLLTKLVLDHQQPVVTFAQDRPMLMTFAPVVRPILPAVVNITSTQIVRTRSRLQLPPGFEDFFGFGNPGGRGGRQMPPEERRAQGTGSGVIVSPDGYILTNNHVVADATQVRITLTDKREFDAKVIGTDPLTDVAVVKINAGAKLPVMPVADSAKIQAGDIVLAIGNPLGLRSTVTMGIVSATGRTNMGIVGEGRTAGYEDFIQTDAPINPGNSGGALVNSAGQLVGINTAILSGTGGNQGIGFAVPSNMARDVMDQLVKTGKVTRGFIGVGIQEVTPQLAEAFKAPLGSVVITEVQPDKPGAKAGLEVGDVVVAINGEEITDSGHFRLRVSRTAPGSTIRLRINRNGQTKEVPVTLMALPARDDEERETSESGGATRSPLEGVDVEPLNAQTRRQLGLESSVTGVVVTDVDPRSPAAEAGLQEGDVIQSVNRQPVTSVSEFNRLVRQSGGRRVILLINRRGASVFVPIETEARRSR
ncbi:MAG TPA: Do family serine endopeptidase [Bryobacteraceae bacterium]|nr:Do family serine endopeptidase [Bryobacteraceae bacterium]